MTSRWDHLLDTKPIPLFDHLLEEVAKLICRDLEKWPLPVESLDESQGQQFAPFVTGEVPRPRMEVYEESFRLAQWELAREIDAYDDYIRNQRWLERGLAPQDRTLLLFISRWLVEQFLGLGEATEGRVKRAHMRDCMERMERRFRRSVLSLTG